MNTRNWVKTTYIPQVFFAMGKPKFPVNPVVSRKNLLVSMQTMQVYQQQRKVARKRLLLQQKCS
ncbi:hypothetical protein ACFL96_05115 [Thermoproteota archaeon]